MEKVEIMHYEVFQTSSGVWAFRLYVTDSDILVGGGYLDRDAAISAVGVLSERVRKGEVTVEGKGFAGSNKSAVGAGFVTALAGIIGALLGVWMTEIDNTDASTGLVAICGAIIGCATALSGAAVKGGMGAFLAAVWVGGIAIALCIVLAIMVSTSSY